MSDINKLVKETKKALTKTQNCCVCHIMSIQSLYNINQTDLRKSVTGLAGGVSNKGYTCGAVFGGSINLALIQDASNNQEISDVDLLRAVNDYVSSFEETFESTLCKEITSLNLRSKLGQLGLLLPWKKNRCLKQAEFGIRHVLTTQVLNSETETISVDHCSSNIWNELKVRVGYEDPHLEKMSKVFTGGMGLSGGACGALSALIMYLGVKYRKLELEINPQTSSKKSYKNLRIASNEVVDQFIDEFGGLECKAITNENFTNIDEFHQFRSEKGCKRVYDFLYNFIN